MQEPERDNPWRRVAASGAAALLALIALAVAVHLAVGDLGLSVNGYIALVSGALGAVALAVGLMSLMFFSDRHGYDDEAGLPGDDTERR